jgi:DNA-binding NtrC family response regulator
VPGDAPTVLVVDDEADVTEVYALWLQAEDYDVRTATGGIAAMDEMDEDVDVVLLDRRMPEVSGDQVLERIREVGYDVQVAMVTAVDPDFDLVEMDFEAYLTKPVMEGDLYDTVERLLELRGDESERERHALEQKKSALRSQKDPDELEDSEAFDDLNARLQRLEDG